MHRYPTRLQTNQIRSILRLMKDDQIFVIHTMHTIRRTGAWNESLRDGLNSNLNKYLTEWAEFIIEMKRTNYMVYFHQYTKFLQKFITIMNYLKWFNERSIDRTVFACSIPAA